jgi:high frequency lysogenization protein
MSEHEHRAERTQYAVVLLYLERKLSRKRAMSALVREGIEKAREQLAHFELTHINVISRLADTYQQSISRLRPRIIVRGDQTHLTNPDNASRIRALLLAGVRAAVLWPGRGHPLVPAVQPRCVAQQCRCAHRGSLTERTIPRADRLIGYA